MRIQIGCLAALVAIGACGSSPNAGPLGEGMSGATRIVAVDSARPPASLQADLEQPGYVAVLLVAPGYSATLLYPSDSVRDNRHAAGRSTVQFRIPGLLIRSDSAMIAQRRDERRREDSLARIRARTRSAGRRPTALTPLPPETPTYLLLVTSPQPLEYQRIIDKTAGVSIPLVDNEALNAVGKAIRSTLPEPRTMAGYYQIIALTR